MNVQFRSLDLTGLAAAAEKVAATLVAHTQPPFCLYLGGSLGAGKTTLSQHLLRALGLEAGIPVTSPTFTYVCEYKIAGLWYAHLDLYRLGPNADIADLIYARDYAGYLIEWPDRANCATLLPATHTIAITPHASGLRDVTFSS